MKIKITYSEKDVFEIIKAHAMREVKSVCHIEKIKSNTQIDGGDTKVACFYGMEVEMSSDKIKI